MRNNKQKKKFKSSLKDEPASCSKADAQRVPQPLFKEENPLRIDLILEVLFDFCTTSTLRNCRLVCKQWMNVSLRAWRNKATLCLNKKWIKTSRASSFSIKDYLLYQLKSQQFDNIAIPWQLRRKLDKYKSLLLPKYPFKNFRIDTSTLDYIHEDTKPVTDNAHRVVLHNIKTGYRDFEAFLSRLPCLESLEIRNSHLKWKSSRIPFVSRNVKHLKICYQGKLKYYKCKKRFFQHFPNVETLSLEYRTMQSCLYDAMKILKFIKITRQTKNMLSLKKLEIMNIPAPHVTSFPKQKFDMNIIDTIANCNFPLEKLALSLAFKSGKMKIGIQSMARLLTYPRSELLQYLRICFYFDIDLFIDRVISKECKEEEYMRKLKAMLKPIPDINIFMSGLKELNVANGLWGLYMLAHLHFPNLEKLVVEYGKHKKKMNVLDYQVGLLKEKYLPKLETFELIANHEIPRPETIIAISNMMPNLCALTCPLDKETFPYVCEHFGGLKTLNILGAKCKHSELELLDDETLTGVTKEEGPRSPNITHLVGLIDLIISRYAGVFSNNSVLYGFLQIPKLHYLSVAFKEISDESKTKLLNHVNGTVQIQREQYLNFLGECKSGENITAEKCCSSDDTEESDLSEVSSLSAYDSSSESID